MERINEYIHFDILKDDLVFETKSIVQQDDFNLYLNYSLLKDYLFDFANKVIIRIDNAYFEKYNQSFKILVEKQNICCVTLSKLHDLISCKLEGIARSVYLESIVLYLLFQIQKNNRLLSLNCKSCGLLNKTIEIEKIQKAKDFITDNIDKTITIPIIAGFVGTNQCYLKKSFKEITGQTIFEFLQENRMFKARQILQTTNKSIAEISSMVGYASISSFSQTYKNYFGISPSTEQKQIIPNL